MRWDPAYLAPVVMDKFFIQANRSAELMRAQDEKMLAAIEKMQADGYDLKSIHYDF